MVVGSIKSLRWADYEVEVGSFVVWAVGVTYGCSGGDIGQVSKGKCYMAVISYMRY